MGFNSRSLCSQEGTYAWQFQSIYAGPQLLFDPPPFLSSSFSYGYNTLVLSSQHLLVQ